MGTCLSSLSPSHFLKTLMRAHCWQSHVQKSNLITDAVILWIPSLAAANGWCADDSVKALIDPLVNCIPSKGRAELGEMTEASGEGPQQHQSLPLPTVLAWVSWVWMRLSRSPAWWKVIGLQRERHGPRTASSQESGDFVAIRGSL